MRPSLRKSGFALLKYLAPVTAITFLTLSMMGCQDTRISVQEFIAMQQRADADLAKTTSTSARCIQANREGETYRTYRAPTSPQAPASSSNETAPAPAVQPSTQPMESSMDIEYGETEQGANAVRRSTVTQVRLGKESNANAAKPNWFFDPKRGEWVKVALPKTKRVRHRSSRANKYPAEAYRSTSPSVVRNASYENDASEDGGIATGPAASGFPAVANQPMPGTTPPPINELVRQANRPYLLGPEDLLTITLTGLTGIDTIAEPAAVEVRVAHDGTINLPLIGAVRVGGLEIIDAERLIHAAYVPKFVPTLSVGLRVEAFKTADVVVVGAAELPGIVQLRQNQRTALHAVAAAGGMTQLASGEVIIQRIRDPENKISVFLRNSADLQAVLAMDPLESGDVIEVVAAQPNTIFVGGLVNLPGPREFPPGTEVTALQALAAAGGVVEPVFPKEATLIRRMPNGEDVHVRIDLDKTRSGEDPNVKLAPGDIFWVPETWGTRTMAFINQSFFVRAGATVSYNVTGIEFLNRPRQQIGNVGGNVQNNVDPLGFLVP